MKDRCSLNNQHNVPKLYKAAAKILKLVKENGASVKNLVYDKKYKHHNIPALYALVNEANKKWDSLENVIEKTGIFRNNPRLNPWLGRVLMIDLIRGKCCKSKCRPVLYVKQYTDAIRESIATNTEKQTDKLRYIRVNTLKASVEDMIEWFIQEEGWKFLAKGKTYKEHLRLIEEQLLASSFVFTQDIHIPEVLVFPSGHGSYFYQLGLEEVVLQDKASCLDAFLLQPRNGGIVLDMCAAPGMKTSHLAAIMENSGKIYAVERNFERFKTLQDMLSQSGATNVTTIHKDVTKIGPDMCPGVEYIILDPSCSGSGLSDRVDSVSQARLEKLGGMQFTLLRHALTSFPSAKRILYSTCSVHTQENEEVIQSALDKVQHNFQLVDLKSQLPGWVNFASEKFSFGSKCIYARPSIDRTTGFFIAIFERFSDDDFKTVNFKLRSKKKKKPKQVYDGRIDIQEKNNKLEVKQEKNKIGSASSDLNNKIKKRNRSCNTEDESNLHGIDSISLKRKECIVDYGLPENSERETKFKRVKKLKAKNKFKDKNTKKAHNVFTVIG